MSSQQSNMVAAAEDRLTQLIFTLPAEIRNEIYSLTLPKSKPRVPLIRSCPQLRWLACSTELFSDAAAMFYGRSCFYHGTRMSMTRGDKSLAQVLNQHIRNTYAGVDGKWIAVTAGRLVKELALDLRMAHEQVGDLPGRLRWFLADLPRLFPNLKTLYVFFGPEYMATDIGMVHVRNDSAKFEREWMRPEDYAEGDHFTKGIAVVNELCPQGCDLRWRVSGKFNVINTGIKLNASSRRKKMGGVSGQNRVHTCC